MEFLHVRKAKNASEPEESPAETLAMQATLGTI